MFQRGTMVLLSGLLLALAAEAQPGPGLFGDRRWRGPVADAAALPASGTTGEVRLTLDDGALHFWDGDSWEDVAGGGGGEANTASNVGGGLGLFSAKVGVDLRFNSLNAADFDLSGNVISIDNATWAKDSELPSGDPPHSRIVTVDAGGFGDYSTIEAALAYVATQTRSEATQWLVLVYPGQANPALGYSDLWNYEIATPITVPSFTTVQGVAAGHETPAAWNGVPIVHLTMATGPAVTMQSGSALVNLRLAYFGTPSEPLTVVTTEATAAYASTVVLTNVVIDADVQSGGAPAITNLSNLEDAIGVYTYETSLLMQGPVAAGSSLATSSSTAGTSIYGGRHIGASGCAAAFRSTGGTMKFFWSRIDHECTDDILISGTGSVRVISTPYETASGGAVIHDDGTQGIQFCKSYSGSGSPEGVVSAPVCASYWRRDGGAFTALYLKQSGSGNSGWVAVGASAQALSADPANCSAGNVSTGINASGVADCVADDDVPESGDFGALALTGDVTSSGLATTISADSVALGTDTTGNYAGSSSEGGSATTAVALAANGANCTTPGEFATGIDASGNAEGCAAPSGGSGDVAGPASSADNALARFDGTTGKLIQNSTVTLSDTGVMVLPDGTEAAPTLKFASFGTTGLYGAGATSIAFSVSGVTRWTWSNSALFNQNGSYFQNQGIGNPIFSPGLGAGSPDLDSGLGANASNDLAMWAGNSISHRWLLVSSGLPRSLVVGQASDNPQAATCANSGDASPGALTLNVTAALVLVTNSDADGCAVTLGETNVASGVRVQIIVTSTAGGSVAFSDAAGVTELAGAFNAGLYDSLDLRYISDRWVESGRSDN